MIKDASEIIGEDVDSSIWFQTTKPRWYFNFASGSELDLIIFVVLSPAILLTHLIPRPRNQSSEFWGHDGLICCALSDSQMHFISGKLKWTGTTSMDALLASYPKSELVDIVFQHAHNTPVLFQFSSTPEISWYFSGVWSDLAECKLRYRPFHSQYVFSTAVCKVARLSLAARYCVTAIQGVIESARFVCSGWPRHLANLT